MSLLRRVHTPTIEELVDLQLRVWGEGYVRNYYDAVLSGQSRNRAIRRRLTKGAITIAVVSVAVLSVMTAHNWRRQVGGRVATVSPGEVFAPTAPDWGVVGPVDPALATTVSGAAHSGTSSLRTGNDGRRQGSLIAASAVEPWKGTRYFSAWLELPDGFASRSAGPWLVMRWGDPALAAHARTRSIDVWLSLSGRRVAVSVATSSGTYHAPPTLVRKRWAHIELAVGSDSSQPDRKHAQVWVDSSSVFSSDVGVGSPDAWRWSVGLRSPGHSHDFVLWADRAIATHYVE
jgi:hypothetical protein